MWRRIFIRALKNGYLVEIQEPSTILQPGVLVGLNSLLEQGGAITLPTGKVIHQPPGRCGGGHHQHQLRGLPGHQPKRSGPHEPDQGHGASTPEVMAQRAMAVTGAADECQVIQMVQVVSGLAEFLPEKRHHRRLRGNAGPHRLDRQRPDLRRPLHLRSGHGDLQSRRGRGGPGSIDHRGAGTGVRPPAGRLEEVDHGTGKSQKGQAADPREAGEDHRPGVLHQPAAGYPPGGSGRRPDKAVRRQHRRVRVCLLWQPDRDDLAFTDNLTITLNPGHPAITQFPTRGERYHDGVRGCSPTNWATACTRDFLAQQTYRNNLANGRWYPSPPELYRIRDVKTERELWEYAQKEPENLVLLGRVALGIGNVLEDAVVENKVLEEFPGTLGQALGFVRAWQWREMPTVTQLKELESPRDSHVLQPSSAVLVLWKVWRAEIRRGTPQRGRTSKPCLSCCPCWTRTFSSLTAGMRWNTVNQILICCWGASPGLPGSSQGLWKDSGKQGTVFAQLEAELSALVGGFRPGGGRHVPPPRRRKKRLLSLSRGNGRPPARLPQGHQSPAGLRQTRGGGPEEPGRIPLAETNQVSEPLGSGGKVREDYVPELSKTMEREMEQLLENMAEITVCRELEQDRLGETESGGQNASPMETSTRGCP